MFFEAAGRVESNRLDLTEIRYGLSNMYLKVHCRCYYINLLIFDNQFYKYLANTRFFIRRYVDENEGYLLVQQVVLDVLYETYY